MTRFLLVALIAFAAGCPSAPRPILTDLPQRPTAGYRYASLDEGRARAVEATLDREAIVARYATKGRVAYVVRDTAQTKAALGALPFRSLDKATLVVRVARVSDINGWGTEVNGEVHRAETLKLEVARHELGRAFALLQQLHTDPRTAIAQHWPEALARVDAAREVTLFERGYQLSVDATLVTGNPFDTETRVPLYAMGQRLPYTAL